MMITSTKVLLLVCCMLCCEFKGQIIDLTDQKYGQDYWQHKVSFHNPLFKMMHRHVTYSVSGYLESITLVFQATKPFHIRWFRKEQNLTNSEIPHKISLEGDPNYHRSIMRSGSLWSSRLLVHGSTQCREFATIINSADGSFQYNIFTKVEAWSSETRHAQSIEGPDWLVLPPGVMVVPEDHKLAFTCAVLVSEERSGFAEELVLSRGMSGSSYDQLERNSFLFPSTQSSALQMRWSSIFSTHNYSRGRVEKHGNSLLAGKIIRISKGEVIYQVGLTSHKASVTHSGNYKCSFDRRDDHLILVTKVKVLHDDLENDQVGGRKVGSERKKGKRNQGYGGCRKCGKKMEKSKRSKNSKILEKGEEIQIELMSCEGGGLVEGEWLVREGTSTCLRCRGRSGGRLRVRLQRDGVDLEKVFQLPLDSSHKNFLKNIRHSKIYLLNQQRKKRNASYHRTPPRTRRTGRSEEEGREDLLQTCSNSTAPRCVGVQRFVNVADGGVFETCLTLHNANPTSFPTHGRHFTCHVSNSSHQKQLHFRVRYV